MDWGCCENSNLSILINGRPRGKNWASRGIRQGDPLSSFLFTIVLILLAILSIYVEEKAF